MGICIICGYEEARKVLSSHICICDDCLNKEAEARFG